MGEVISLVKAAAKSKENTDKKSANSTEFDFETQMKINKEKDEKLKKNRSQTNKSVSRSYNLTKK